MFKRQVYVYHETFVCLRNIVFQTGCELMGRKSTQTYKYILKIEILNYFTRVIEKGDYTEYEQMSYIFTGFCLHAGFPMGYGTACHFPCR